MNKILIGLKKFFTNKNTVTIIGVILIIGLLYFGYTRQINSAVKGVSVPVAVDTIQPRTEINASMVTTISIPAIAVPENVVKISSLVIGKYTNVNTIIPKGSMFYSESIISKEQLPDASITEVKDGEIPVYFRVNMESTYGNSVYPGNKIDLYMRATDTNGKLMVGKLIANIEVLGVKDSSGRNVFENSTETRTPAYLIYGLQEKIFILLKKAENLSGINLFIVPQGGTINNDGATVVSTAYLENYINARSIDLLPVDTKDTTIDTTNGD